MTEKAVKRKRRFKKSFVVRLAIILAGIAALLLLLLVRCEKSFDDIYLEAMNKSGVKYRSSAFLSENADKDIPVPSVNKKTGFFRYTAELDGKTAKLTDYIYTDARIATRMTVNGQLMYIAAAKNENGWFYLVFKPKTEGKKTVMTVDRLSDKAYENCEPFNEGLSAVLVGGKYGFIGVDGKPVIEPEYDDVRYCARGLIPALSGEDWYYIDVNGTRIYGPYAAAESFSKDGYACVKDIESDYFYYISTDGIAVTQAVFEDAWECEDGSAFVKQSGKWSQIETGGWEDVGNK